MTLDQIRKQLAELKLPGDTIVVLSSDGEGNSFSPLSDIADHLRYEAKSTWSGEVFNPNECRQDCFEWGRSCECKPFTGGVPAVVLWPTN